MQPTRGHLAESSPRYQDWLAVFGTNVVELESALPIPATVPGVGSTAVYRLKLSSLDAGQRERLVAKMAAKFQMSPEDVSKELDGAHGCPILAEDVMVVVDRRLVL